MFLVYKLYVNYSLLNALLLKPVSFSGHSVSHPETPGFQLQPFWGIAFGSRELLCFLLRAAHAQWLVSEGDTKASHLASIWDNAEAHPSSRVQHFPPPGPPLPLEWWFSPVKSFTEPLAYKFPSQSLCPGNPTSDSMKHRTSPIRAILQSPLGCFPSSVGIQSTQTKCPLCIRYYTFF